MTYFEWEYIQTRPFVRVILKAEGKKPRSSCWGFYLQVKHGDVELVRGCDANGFLLLSCAAIEKIESITQIQLGTEKPFVVNMDKEISL